MVPLTEKPRFFAHHCMNNHGEIEGPLQTFSTKKAKIYEFFVANPLHSCVMLYWLLSIILDNFGVIWALRYFPRP